MAQLLNLLIVGFMVAALAVVLLGVLNLARAGRAGRLRSNRLMQLRVLFQALAVILIGALMFAAGS